MAQSSKKCYAANLELHMYWKKLILQWHVMLKLPVVVEVCQLVYQLLDVLEFRVGRVHNNVVRGRVDCSLPHGLGQQEEVVPLWQRNNVVDHSSTWRIVKLNDPEPSYIIYHQPEIPQWSEERKDGSISKDESSPAREQRKKVVKSRDLQESKEKEITESDMEMIRGVGKSGDQEADVSITKIEHTRGNIRKVLIDKVKKDEKSLKISQDKRVNKTINKDSPHPKDRKDITVSIKYRKRKNGKRGYTQGNILTHNERIRFVSQGRNKDQDISDVMLSIIADHHLYTIVVFDKWAATGDNGKCLRVYYDTSGQSKNSTWLIFAEMYVFPYISIMYSHKDIRGTYVDLNVIILTNGDQISRRSILSEQNLTIHSMGQFHVCQLVLARILTDLLNIHGDTGSRAKRVAIHQLDIFKDNNFERRTHKDNDLTKLKVVSHGKGTSDGVINGAKIIRAGRAMKTTCFRHIRRHGGESLRDGTKLGQSPSPVENQPKVRIKENDNYLLDWSGGQWVRKTTWNKILLLRSSRSTGLADNTRIQDERGLFISNQSHTTKVIFRLFENVWSPVLQNLAIITIKENKYLRPSKICNNELTKRNPENLIANYRRDLDRSRKEEIWETGGTWCEQIHEEKELEPHNLDGWDRLTSIAYICMSESPQISSRISRPASNSARTKRGYKEETPGQATTHTSHPITSLQNGMAFINSHERSNTGINYKREEKEPHIHAGTKNTRTNPTTQELQDHRSRRTSWSRCGKRLLEIGKGGDWEMKIQHERFQIWICKNIICKIHYLNILCN